MEYMALCSVLSMDMLDIPAVGLDLENHNKVFSVTYNPIQKVVRFNYKIRLFKK